MDSDTSRPQIRLGIQGYPKTGKTFNALSFPNPVVINMDRGLGAHIGRSDVVDVPFYNPAYVDSIVKRDGAQAPVNKRDALLKWLMTTATQLISEQTLILDGSTSIQNAFHTQYNLNPVLTKNGKIDDFAEWRLKGEYFGQLCDQIKMLKCDVVYICHETPDRDTSGSLNGMVRPLLTGQFGDQLASHFTDWFRSWAISKSISDMKKFMDWSGMSEAQVKETIANSSTDTIYLWQTMSDNIAKCGTSTLVGQPKMILANYSSFVKYGRSKQKTESK